MADPDDPNGETSILRKLNDRYGYWDAHATWPVEDWKTEVDNGDTRHGYWEWVANQIELHGGDGSGED